MHDRANLANTLGRGAGLLLLLVLMACAGEFVSTPTPLPATPTVTPTPASTPSVTPAPTPTLTPTPVPTPTFTPAPTPTSTPVSIAQVTREAGRIPTPSSVVTSDTPTSVLTPTATPSPEPTPAPTPTPSPTPTAVPTPTATPSPQPSPTPTPTATRTPSPTPAPGYSRANPADIGGDLFIKVEGFEDYEARTTLFQVIRGEEAWETIKEANILAYGSTLADPPEAGFEYVLARIRFEYLKGPDQETVYHLSAFDFRVISSDGKAYDHVFLIGGPEPELSAELYPGASHEGWVVFQVAEHDTAPLMTFGRDYRGRGGVWWKLYE